MTIDFASGDLREEDLIDICVRIANNDGRLTAGSSMDLDYAQDMLADWLTAYAERQYAAMASTLDHLDAIVREHRRGRRMSLREAAASSGVPMATLFRVERGDGVNAKTAAALLRWMDLGTESA